MDCNKLILVKQHFLSNSHNFDWYGKFTIREKIEKAHWTVRIETHKDKLIKQVPNDFNIKLNGPHLLKWVFYWLRHQWKSSFYMVWRCTNVFLLRILIHQNWLYYLHNLVFLQKSMIKNYSDCWSKCIENWL